MTLDIVLNGTDENPWHRWGLTQNPFPQTAKAELDPYALHLQKLGADPIPDADHIRRHLTGWSQEFIELCCAKFEKGRMVRFTVEFGEQR